MISADIRSDHRSTIETLLFSIDESNKTLMLMCRSFYEVYRSDPCKYGDLFAHQVDYLGLWHIRITESASRARILCELQRQNPDSTEIVALYREIMDDMRPASPLLNRRATEMAIDDARDSARSWIGTSGCQARGRGRHRDQRCDPCSDACPLAGGADERSAG